ncbi:MAG: hypothetical protein WCG87_09405 [Bacteroidota bacterium]
MRKWLLITSMLLALSPVAWSQCSVCTKTAAQLDKKSAKGLNGGVIYLAFIPLGIIGTVGFIWWKSNRTSE